jgi:hypothetical protein
MIQINVWSDKSLTLTGTESYRQTFDDLFVSIESDKTYVWGVVEQLIIKLIFINELFHIRRIIKYIPTF